MNYILLDLEATCWRERGNGKVGETIEIGAVKINENGDEVDRFNEFIKPINNPHLSDFCTELTTITQEYIDSSDTYNIVIKRFQNWINLDNDYLLCSWGFYDRTQFSKDCILHDLDIEWLENHISIKHQYSNIKHSKKKFGMSKALKLEGFKLDGTHHRGIDDAINISKIFVKYLDKWVY